MTYHKLALQ